MIGGLVSICGELTSTVLEQGVAEESSLAVLTVEAVRIVQTAETFSGVPVAVSWLDYIDVVATVAGLARASGYLWVTEIVFRARIASRS